MPRFYGPIAKHIIIDPSYQPNRPESDASHLWDLLKSNLAADTIYFLWKFIKVDAENYQFEANLALAEIRANARSRGTPERVLNTADLGAMASARANANR